MSETVPEQGGFPQQVQIDAYGNGGFRFGGMSHHGSLLCLPGRMVRWDVGAASEITRAALQPVFDAAADIDVLMIGLGREIVGLDRELREELRASGVIVEAIATGGAVRTYNILLGEDRAVAAALIAVDDAK
ncbi:Mth938-like domain-containing protein [Devosia sp.]|uniref:Mth938-like domain-containing protein n=1 Tax=Devosia sp. TaxID=1871048 RepID=UPI003A94D9CD